MAKKIKKAAEKRYVVLRMPEDAWDTLRETLEVDSESSAFDSDLQNNIRLALDKVETLEIIDEGCLESDRKRERAEEIASKRMLH